MLLTKNYIVHNNVDTTYIGYNNVDSTYIVYNNVDPPVAVFTHHRLRFSPHKMGKSARLRF